MVAVTSMAVCVLYLETIPYAKVLLGDVQTQSPNGGQGIR